MGVVTTEPRTLSLPASRPLRRADLAALPDDGHRYELLDGSLIVTPSPSQGRLLYEACPDDVEILLAPFDVALADDTVLQPDVLVARLVDLTHRDLPTAPLLAIEVFSPEHADHRSRREEGTLRSRRLPRLLGDRPADGDPHRLGAGERVYVQVAQVAGDEVFAAARPFPVEVVPNRLVTR